MNIYRKYCANVYVAECEEEHKKDDIIIMTTRRGKENESIIYNHLFSKDGKHYYSIVRADRFNIQERAKRKAEKYENLSCKAEGRSNDWIEKSNEGREFLSLGEPIKIGHHSEKRHRALIERNNKRIANSVKESKKVEKYEQKKEYWENQTNKIDLSMPESIEYYLFMLEKAKKNHAGLKDGTIKREHSYSLAYAKKTVNELEKKCEIARKLWG